MPEQPSPLSIHAEDPYTSGTATATVDPIDEWNSALQHPDMSGIESELVAVRAVYADLHGVAWRK